jgi:hypothetical protein
MGLLAVPFNAVCPLMRLIAFRSVLALSWQLPASGLSDVCAIIRPRVNINRLHSLLSGNKIRFNSVH